MDLGGKALVVTGGATGLGAVFARALAARGAKLALLDRDREGLERLRAELEEAGHSCRIHVVDVVDEAGVVAAFERVVAEFGRLDGLINNAGVLRDGLLVKSEGNRVVGRLSLADWQAVIDVNLTGVFLCGREAAARMIECGHGGAIVNLSSISRAGNYGQSNYAAAKAGVAALTVVWARELGRHGIRVNALAPGFTNAGMATRMREDLREKIAAGIPLGRLGEAEEIASAALFLLENDFVSGRVLEIDGGQRL